MQNDNSLTPSLARRWQTKPVTKFYSNLNTLIKRWEITVFFELPMWAIQRECSTKSYSIRDVDLIKSSILIHLNTFQVHVACSEVPRDCSVLDRKLTWLGVNLVEDLDQVTISFKFNPRISELNQLWGDVWSATITLPIMKLDQLTSRTIHLRFCTCTMMMKHLHCFKQREDDTVRSCQVNLSKVEIVIINFQNSMKWRRELLSGM